jgi:hypothetical protein
MATMDFTTKPSALVDINVLLHNLVMYLKRNFHDRGCLGVYNAFYWLLALCGVLKSGASCNTHYIQAFGKDHKPDNHALVPL